MLVFLAQQDPAASASAIQGWIQVAASTGFAGLAWYLIAVALPKMQERFDSHSDRQQEQYLKESEKQRIANEVVIKRIVDHQERQLDRVLSLLSKGETP